MTPDVRRPGPGGLLQEDQLLARRQVPTAVLLGPAEPGVPGVEEPALPVRVPGSAGDPVVTRRLRRQPRQLGGEPLPEVGAEGLVGLGVTEIHAVAESTGRRCSTRTRFLNRVADPARLGRVRRMDYSARIDALEREIASLVAAVGSGPLGAPVPTCPDFTVDELAAHVGTFCGWWTHNLCEGSGSAQDAVRGRVDAQLARGAADPVEAELAADGIEEVFLLATSRAAEMRVGSKRADRTERSMTLHLHGTDYTPAEWLLTLDSDGIQVTREHAKGDLALKGPVSDLELLLYQRPTLGNVDRFGDESVLAAFHREFTFV